MILKIFYLNRSRKQQLILLHGLFSHPGFWLPYLPLFSNFQCIIPYIDFNSLLTSKNSYNGQLSTIRNIIISSPDIIVIGHSLGSVFIENLPSKKHRGFAICPMIGTKCIKKNLFLKYLVQATAHPYNHIKNVLDSSSKFLNTFNLPYNQNNLYFIPSNDHIFSYPTIAGSIAFHGDHFEITNGIKACLNKVCHMQNLI